MVSRLARRSGIAVVQIAEDIVFWKPDLMVHVGVGMEHPEVQVMRELVWPDLEFIGFEPNPETFAKIKDIYPGELHQFAIGSPEQNGTTATLYSPYHHQDGGSLYQRNPNDRQYEVQIRSLDSLFELWSSNDNVLLWIDAEGNDLNVVRGAENFITQVAMINIEMTASNSVHGTGSPLEVQKWLNAHGFRRQWLHTQRIHAGQTDSIYVREEMLDPGICCCPCQLENLPARDCPNALDFWEVEAHKDGRINSRRGGRTIRSKNTIQFKECDLRTQKDEPRRRRHYWRVRWCGYAVSEELAIEQAKKMRDEILAGKVPEGVDMGKNIPDKERAT